jgi:hypothetical protein
LQEIKKRKKKQTIKLDKKIVHVWYHDGFARITLVSNKLIVIPIIVHVWYDNEFAKIKLDLSESR